MEHDPETGHPDDTRLQVTFEHSQLNERQLDQWLEDHPQVWYSIKREKFEKILHLFEWPISYAEMLKQARQEASAQYEREQEWKRESARRASEDQYRSEQAWREVTNLFSRSSLEDALACFEIKHSEASLDVIKKRFRALALKTHPDHGGQASDFRRVNNAYEVLKKHYT
jgi:hypothetical protein